MHNDPYKRISSIYDSLFASINKGLQGIGFNLVPPERKMKVLDVGCGTGQFLEKYKQADCEVYGIDLSPSMLEHAQKRLGKDADIQIADAADMPYDDGEFDLVMSSLVLHELNEPTRSVILNEMIRVLDKDGRILIIDFFPGPINSFKRRYRKFFITITEIMAGRG